MNISGSFFFPQHITMRIALGEVSFQSEAITRRHCLWKYFSGAFLGILLKIIWFKPSDLLAIFVSNGQAKTPRPFPKAICTSFLNTISKSVVCFQVHIIIYISKHYLFILCELFVYTVYWVCLCTTSSLYSGLWDWRRILVLQGIFQTHEKQGSSSYSLGYWWFVIRPMFHV